MEHEILSAVGLEAVTRIREICAGLPEAEEKIDGFGHTVFHVRNKSFVMMGERQRGCSIAFKTSPATQEILLQQPDAPYFKTPYIGQHGWVSLIAAETTNWAEAASLVREGYCRAAPKRLAHLVLERMRR
ncbi:MmcQ/YjbR family DNA-binding protein [Cohnella nanjingensis]|uniref:MmcQ/YjbR family DNA-binding protein n=1 Tax=Cohnella nanjingensis TaxID=1387779 RepID=A0A7X0RKQ9_9BACL|nr:MmcQ/YjbR family DNA-binding protein [Cohnella nanjingensis]MBB6669282.1 MmcQ/YjbR family DNA-binding protein [Cohnella nanjingensis]